MGSYSILLADLQIFMLLAAVHFCVTLMVGNTHAVRSHVGWESLEYMLLVYSVITGCSAHD